LQRDAGSKFPDAGAAHRRARSKLLADEQLDRVGSGGPGIALRAR
jgi:hypothetical protein